MKINKTTLKLLTLFYIVIVVNSNHAAFSTGSNYKIRTKKHHTSVDPVSPNPPTASTSPNTPTAPNTPNTAAPSSPTTVTPTGTPIEMASKDDLPDLPIYFQGWVKYFRYLDQQTTDRPKTFFNNTMYYSQPAGKTDKDEVSDLYFILVRPCLYTRRQALLCGSL
jgi:hypothetical protein